MKTCMAGNKHCRGSIHTVSGECPFCRGLFYRCDRCKSIIAGSRVCVCPSGEIPAVPSDQVPSGDSLSEKVNARTAQASSVS